MKKIALLTLLSVAAVAGPLKVASYPLRKGPMAKVEVFTAKVFYHVGKAILW